MIEAVLVGAVRGGTSLLFATVGETIAERSGVINLSTEGSMLTGALAAYVTAVQTGSVWLGAIVGGFAGLALAAIHAFVVIARGGNQLATGLAVLFLAIGVTALLGRDYVGRDIEGFSVLEVPGLSEIPWIGPALFAQKPLTYVAFAIAPLAWWVLFRTRAGLAVRAAGERGEVLYAYGRSPGRVRALAVLAGGFLAGVGGAELSTAAALTWSEGMTAGRGFVAVGLVIFAAWNPLMAMVGAALFGGIQALQLQLQVEGAGISPFLLDASPYLVVLVVLAAFSYWRADAAPAGLRRVFEVGR